MRFSFLGQTRPDPWDRNPRDANKNFGGTGIAPHGTTARWTYTVPVNKKALVSSLFIKVKRRAAAGPASYPAITINLDGNLYLGVGIFENTVSAKEEASMYGQLYMTAGQVIEMNTSDGSTGGTVDYEGYSVITEFDA